MIDLAQALTKEDDYKIYRWLLKHRPHSVIQAVKAVAPPKTDNSSLAEPSYYQECRNLRNAGRKVEAIKKWRAMTRDSLADAFKAVTAL